MIKRVDAFLLDRAQKFCDKFQRLTGLTKFRLEKWSLILSSVFYWMFAIGVLDEVLTVMALLLSIHTFYYVRAIERQEMNFLARSELEFRAEHHCSIRTIFLLLHVWILAFGLIFAFALIDPSGIWLCGYSAFVIVTAYLAACTPRPPSKSSMREWLERCLIRINSLLPEPAMA